MEGCLKWHLREPCPCPSPARLLLLRPVPWGVAPAGAPAPSLVGSPPISLLLRLLPASGLPPRRVPLPSSCVLSLCFLLAFNSTGFLDSSQASLCSHVPVTLLRFATSLALRFFEKGKVSYAPLLITSESQQGCASPSFAVRCVPSPGASAILRQR